MSTPIDPLGTTRAQWGELAIGWGLPRYRGDQIFDALHRRRVADYGDILDLPRSLRERLAQEIPVAWPQIVRREEASDGSVKFGLALADGALIEVVFMPGDGERSAANEFADARAAESSEPARAGGRGSTPRARQFTVCLSSQTGCAVDCAFCVTGRLGGGRNLSAGEIVGQLYAVLAETEQTTTGLRVVFMGMGEPFLNPDGVLTALDILYEQISSRRITVSTSGITPAFATFAAHERRPNLAVSINAADEETRERLMPITRTYPLSGVVAAMRDWPADTRHPITVEYVLIAGINDDPEDAARLSRLLENLPVKINLIPLNEDPTYLPGWKRPDEPAIERFAGRLSRAGWTVTVRRSKGPDAQAACGQLKGRTEDVRSGRLPRYP